ncbi:MAG: T9SS type A sorting domain-containing protein [Bacteroidetes bacterium]|nr:T9SS type A sorting domain-containing protein [Bacteroidota bacterium]
MDRSRMLFIIVLVVVVMPDLSAQQEVRDPALASAAPNASNFAYPQSIFVDSQHGHLWVTDFDHHRVLRFDVSSLTAIERWRETAVPGSMMLAQNFPNPFNPSTRIAFSVPHTGRAELSVHTVLGQQVAVLFAGEASARTVYSLAFNAGHLSSGIYLYALRSDAGTIVRRMSLIK